MSYWLIKSEPSAISICDMMEFPNQTIEWFGIRNYQARNFMRDEMQVGDKAFFWHSSCKYPGIYGIVQVISPSHADSHQFDIASKYYDGAATFSNPRWFCVDVQFVTKTRYISIEELRSHPALSTLQVLQRGNRLSISKVTKTQWDFINDMLDVKPS